MIFSEFAFVDETILETFERGFDQFQSRIVAKSFDAIRAANEEF